jgi:multicomponent Na+:H+ antiporter subunit D
MSGWTVAPVAGSLVAAILCLLVTGPVVRRVLAGAGALFQLVLALVFVAATAGGERWVLGIGNWPAHLGIVLVVDLPAAIMLALSGLMLVGCMAYSFFELEAEREHPLRLPLWHFLAAGVNLSFVTGDLFNLFVAFELMLIASYALLTLEADDWDIKQAFPYVALNLVGGCLFLVAVGMCYAVFGTLNMGLIAERAALLGDHPVVGTVAVMLFVVFGIKAGVFPLYYWLPNSYPILAAPLAAFYAGMLTKVGVYVLLRIYGTVLPADLHWIHLLMGSLAAFTMISAVLGAVSRGFIRGILSWHILSQIGYMVVAIGLFTRMAMAACILYVIHHIVVKGTLFLAGAAAAARNGGSDDLDRMGGIIRRHPVLGACFLLQALSLTGVPPLSGFWGKYVIISEGLRAGHLFWVAAAVAAGVLTLFSMLKIWNGAFWGEENDRESALSPARLRGMTVVIALLTLVSLAIGLGAGAVLDLSLKAADVLMDSAGYTADIKAFVGKGGL